MASQFARAQNESPEGRIGASLTPFSGGKCAILFAGAISEDFLHEREHDTATSNDEIEGVFPPLHTKNDLFLCKYEDNPAGPPFFQWFSLNASDPPEARAFHASTIIEAQSEQWLLVYGGKTDERTLCKEELYLLYLSCDENQLQWVKLNCKGQSPGRRYGHTMVCMNACLIVFGGHNGETALNDVWIIDFKNSTLRTQMQALQWREINFYEFLKPPPRYHHAAVPFYDGSHVSMIIYGGCIDNDLPRSRIFSLECNQNGQWYWRILPVWVKCLREQRSHHTLIALQNKILILGGIGESSDAASFETTLKVAVYNMKNYAFYYYHDSVERFGHQSWRLGNVIYSWGGCSPTQSVPFSSPVHSIPFGRMDFDELLITDLLSGEELAALHHTHSMAGASGVVLTESNRESNNLLSSLISKHSLDKSPCTPSTWDFFKDNPAKHPVTSTDISEQDESNTVKFSKLSNANDPDNSSASTALLSSTMPVQPSCFSLSDPPFASVSHVEPFTTSDLFRIQTLPKETSKFSLPEVSPSSHVSSITSLNSHSRPGRSRPLRAAASAALESFKNLPPVVSSTESGGIENKIIEPLSSSASFDHAMPASSIVLQNFTNNCLS